MNTNPNFANCVRQRAAWGDEFTPGGLTRELDYAWEQQTATAEAPKIISTSPTELRTSASPPRSVDVQISGTEVQRP